MSLLLLTFFLSNRQNKQDLEPLSSGAKFSLAPAGPIMLFRYHLYLLYPTDAACAFVMSPDDCLCLPHHSGVTHIFAALLIYHPHPQYYLDITCASAIVLVCCPYPSAHVCPYCNS